MTTISIQNPDLFRQNVVAEFQQLIPELTKATNVEKAVYNWAIKEATNQRIVKTWANTFFVQLYTNRLRSIYANITANPGLLERIISGDLTPQVMEHITHYEMRPDHWDPLIQEKTAKYNSLFEEKVEANTEAYTCRKCKSSRCNYFQLQTRSCDEPMTIFVRCLNCGNRWRG